MPAQEPARPVGHATPPAADPPPRRGGTLRGALALATRLGASLADAALPRCCAMCRQALRDGAPHLAPHLALCARCLDALPGRGAPRCPRCGLADRDPSRPCAECLARKPAFDRTIVLADYAPPLDRMIHALKFGHDLALARPLGELLAAALRAHEDAPDLVVAVPLAGSRIAGRGFNQSAEIARAVAREARLRFDPARLRRTREAPPQSTLDPSARRRNLEGAFASGPASGCVAHSNS